MSPWKIVLLIAALAALLLFLAPQRARSRLTSRALVEIDYTGDAGVNKAFLAFEAESRAQHEKDSRHPIYRMINGQSPKRSAR